MLNKIDSWLRRKSFRYMQRRKYADFVHRIDAAKPFMVVFQMGKVGSSTVTATLKGGFPEHNVFQIHFLADDWIERATGQFREASRDHGKPFIDEHVLASRYLNGLYHARTPDAPRWQIISLVREPVARNLSSFFQAFPVYFSARSNSASAEAVAQIPPVELGQMFVREFGEYRHSVPTVWFQTHLQPLFDIDVYAQPFDHAAGFSILESSKARLLLLRAEDVDRVFVDAVEAFLGRRLPALIRKNDASDKVYAETYKETKRLLEIPPDYVDELYSSQYMRHFYTPSEIVRFRERWQAS